MDDRPILIVEDNEADLDLAMMAIRINKITNPVVVAADGSEALDFLFGRGKHAGCSHRPALVLLDLKLPIIDGHEVLRQMRGDETTHLVPVVILSSSVENNDILTSYRLGANSYVQKPVNFEKFVSAIEQLGTYWLGLNEPSYPSNSAC